MLHPVSWRKYFKINVSRVLNQKPQLNLSQAKKILPYYISSYTEHMKLCQSKRLEDVRTQQA